MRARQCRKWATGSAPGNMRSPLKQLPKSGHAPAAQPECRSGWNPVRAVEGRAGARAKALFECINAVLERRANQIRSWLGGLIRFLFKKGDLLEMGNYRPVGLQDTAYKVLSAILTDRLDRLAERHWLLDPSQEGFLGYTRHSARCCRCTGLRSSGRSSRAALLLLPRLCTRLQQ